MSKEKKPVNERVSDQASAEMLQKAIDNEFDTCFTRIDQQGAQCKFGTTGVCCKICHMGPCRITPKAPRGVCGADVDTIVARNFLREVSGGTAAHSDHGRHLVLRLKQAAAGENTGYIIRDEDALRRAARDYEVAEVERTKEEVAADLADLFLQEFSSQEEKLKTLSLAPLKEQSTWEREKISPKGIDRMVVEAMHRTTMGVDHDYRSILMHAFRTSLADGWGGSRVATIVSDILFGTPSPVKGDANLGILKKDTVNIIVHGHEPEVSEMLALAVQDPEMKSYAEKSGANGITLGGICCTANEILMRHGIPIAGNFLQQELAVITGAVETMVIDVQCCMPSLPEIAANYHTEVVSTSEMAKTIGATPMAGEGNALDNAKDIVRRACDNFKNRDQTKVHIPESSQKLIGGFSVEAIKYMLGGSYRKSFRPLNDAIISGRVRGVCGIVGCNNPKSKTDDYINILTKELVKNNVLVLKTGCAAIASAKTGMLKPEAAMEEAGEGLKEVCEAVGIPPVLHMGSCVDNSRILEAASEVVKEGGLGDTLSGLPAVGVAPEWMSEKAVAIGCYFVASGVDVFLGHPFYVSGSEKVDQFLHEGVKEQFGATFHHEADPLKASQKILAIIDEARENLGINKKTERKLFDMKDRREMNV